jgi:hypothetical protein
VRFHLLGRDAAVPLEDATRRVQDLGRDGRQEDCCVRFGGCGDFLPRFHVVGGVARHFYYEQLVTVLWRLPGVRSLIEKKNEGPKKRKGDVGGEGLIPGTVTLLGTTRP